MKKLCSFIEFQRNDLIGKKILSVNEKYYIADHGIRQAVFENNERDINQIFENIVYLELLRRGYNIKIGKIDLLEVDFVCTKNQDEINIYTSSISFGFSRNYLKGGFSVLEKIQDNYPKYVISMDFFNLSQNGIKHLNIIEFLQKDL